MPVIITIQPHLIRIDDGVVVLHGDVLGGAGVAGGLTGGKLFRTFKPELKPQPKRHPPEVLEAEHCFKTVVPDGGEETEVDGIGIIFQDEFRTEPAVLEPDGTPVYTGYHALAVPVHTFAVLIAKMASDNAPRGIEMLGGDCIESIEIAIAGADILATLKIVASRTCHRITQAKRNTRSPLPNLTLLQSKNLGGEMAVLILHNLLTIRPVRALSVRTPVAPKQRAHIIHLKPRPERDAKSIPEGAVIPTIPGKKMLV